MTTTTTTLDWYLECSECGATRDAEGVPTVCECGRPWLVRYPSRVHPVTERAELRRRHGMWRFRSFLPLSGGEQPITLGEGDTPLLHTTRLGAELGLPELRVKDEGANPTGSFKARGLSAAITRAHAAGIDRFTLPTAGNAGVAAAAYGARAGVEVRVFAPDSTPPAILRQIELFGATLVLLDGHIGDCGKASRAWAAESGAMDLSTLREPYRIEGKKTLGLEIAMQLGWRLPDAIIYPTGGGTGLIGMWKAFQELKAAGWVEGDLPRMFTVQSSGCAPIVQAFLAGADHATPWQDPVTVASGLRVPGPSGRPDHAPDSARIERGRGRGGRRQAVGCGTIRRQARRNRLRTRRRRGDRRGGGSAGRRRPGARALGRGLQYRSGLALPVGDGPRATGD